MPWDDGIDWNPGDPLYTDTPDLSPLPEPSPPLINLPINMGPDVNSPDPVAGGGLDWASFIRALTGGVSGAGKSADLSKLFGSGSGSGGDISSILALLALLGGVGSSINAGNTAKQGGQDIKDAANRSNDTANELFGKAQGNFAPYQAAGVSALDRLAVPQDLASKFVAKGAPSNMGGQFKGTMTLADLAKR